MRKEDCPMTFKIGRLKVCAYDFIREDESFPNEECDERCELYPRNKHKTRRR